MDFGMIGLAVMGESLALNIERHGYSVAVYDVRPGVPEAFAQGRGAGKRFAPARSLDELVALVKRPRKLMLMIRAGQPVDQVLDGLIPLLDPGDIVIDGGNSHFSDTARRAALLESHGLRMLGVGVSGGEEGALHGPSLMPGGSFSAWAEVQPLLQSICAQVEGQPCCRWMGPGGAGHFVKMVHNGIEYGDMQLIGEAYHLMRRMLGMTARQAADAFAAWNQGPLRSYLIEITAAILSREDADGQPLVDHILDCAGQKGTGKWTSQAALDHGVPLTLITEAVFARCLSAQKDERVAASGLLSGPPPFYSGDRDAFLQDLEQALYASKLISYAQGFSLLRAASEEFGWDLRHGDIALTWRGGCIIRSAFLGQIKAAYDRDPLLPNLMLDGYFRQQLDQTQAGWRGVCAAALIHGVPVGAMAAALSYYDGYRSARLPASLLQAQRDFFGAHTYERTDASRGQFFHTDWLGAKGERQV